LPDHRRGILSTLTTCEPESLPQRPTSGPGFDVLALALDLYVEVEVEPAVRLTVRATGEGSELAADATHLAASVAIDVAGHDRLAITVPSDIPVARGLGSSAALAVAAAAAAGARDPLAVAARSTATPRTRRRRSSGAWWRPPRSKGAVRAVRMPLDVGLVFVAIVPERSLATSKARQACPSRWPDRRHLQSGPPDLLLAGLADRSLLIREATEDRLHQDYRSPCSPRPPRSWPVWWTPERWPRAGRGRPHPSRHLRRRRRGRIRTQAQAAMAEIGVPGRAMLLRPDLEGLVIDGGDSGTLRHRGVAPALTAYVPSAPGLSVGASSGDTEGRCLHWVDGPDVPHPHLRVPDERARL
jgi:homoserine kinase